jgi:glycerophosphoryl diester phosphodiesterase
VQKSAAKREFLARAWEEGLDVFVWTVNDPHEIEEFVSMGVQGVISDYPERLVKLRNG